MNSVTSTAIDWEDAKRRINLLGQTLKRDEVFTPEEAEAILYVRAQRLAEVVDEAEDASASTEVMIIEQAGERYAVETNVIREVLRPATMSVLPGTASHIAGVMNLRGRPLLIVDARELLGLPAEELPESARVVVIGVAQAEFGLLTEATEEVTTLDEAGILAPPQSLPAATRRFVRGVTSDALIVLDADSLMNDPRLWIDEQED